MTRGWDWDKVSDRAWSEPAEDVYYYRDRWMIRGLDPVLDLGCGIGRHALLLAAHGFHVTAADVSATGLARLASVARERGLEVRRVEADVTELPFPSGCFGAVLAYHSLYHVDTSGMRLALAEAKRVLRSGGEIYLTFIAKDAPSFTDPASTAVEPNVRLKREEDGSVLPHYYVDYREIPDLLAGLTILRVRHVVDYWDGGSGRHYHVHAAKPA